VKGLVLLDPVDNSSFGPQGVGYPSSLPALRESAMQRQLPVLVVGAALNTGQLSPQAFVLPHCPSWHCQVPQQCYVQQACLTDIIDTLCLLLFGCICPSKAEVHFCLTWWTLAMCDLLPHKSHVNAARQARVHGHVLF